MNKLKVSLAISDYDHVRDLTTGRVEARGIDLTPLDLSIEEIFFRFSKFREWDVSEMSFAKYASLISQGDETLTAIPVFPSRVFRQSAVYVRKDAGIKTAKDLAGRTIGIPEWAQTAGIYARGWLTHYEGIDMAGIDWRQAGVNQPGRVEKVKLKLPGGVSIQAHPDSCLSDMLLDGTIPAAITAHPPSCYKDGHPDIERLYEDYQPVEEAYWKETGIFPIMHVIAIRSDLLERAPWAAKNLLMAFEEAKNNSVTRAHEITASRFPVPWIFNQARASAGYFDGDYWPYGIEANRKTLEAFLGFCFEQGACHRKLEVEELFVPGIDEIFKI